MTILRTPDVMKATGLSRTTLWRLERSGRFPERVRLGPNSVGWVESEVLAWIDARPRGMTIANSTLAASMNAAEA